MAEDGNTEIFFDEIDMQDMIEDWSRHYAEGIKVTSWYYDCRSATVLIRLEIESSNETKAGLCDNPICCDGDCLRQL